MKVIEGGITAPKGFMASGVYAGIKKEKKDMALIYSQSPCVAAGTFTKNVVKAAPVKWDMDIVYNQPSAQAIVCNSGIANACTGTTGLGYCKETVEYLADQLNISETSVLVASTGVIGKQLPMDKLRNGIELLVPELSDSLAAGSYAAEAIMTTDTQAKEIAVTFLLDEVPVTIGGMCKGSGMIHPNMCTMLSFLTTDAAISKEMLQELLSENVDDTYNMISVDGDTSTNDTVLLMANGLAGNSLIHQKGENYQKFLDALNLVNIWLCRRIAGDGEGATALFEVKILGAKTKKEAACLAKSVITSNLTKTAIFGHDANWGRILCAMGYSGVIFDPEKVDLYFESTAGKLKIIEDGVATDYSEEMATRILSQPEVTAIADIKMGDMEATAWGCDLTYEYVRINADYRS